MSRARRPDEPCAAADCSRRPYRYRLLRSTGQKVSLCSYHSTANAAGEPVYLEAEKGRVPLTDAELVALLGSLLDETADAFEQDAGLLLPIVLDAHRMTA